MNDRVRDYVKLGCFVLVNIAIYWIIYWMESSKSRLYNPSAFVVISRYLLMLAIPSILAFRLVSYYSIMRYAIISLGVLNTAIIVFSWNMKNVEVFILLGLLIICHIALYFLSIRKEKKQLLREAGQMLQEE